MTVSPVIAFAGGAALIVASGMKLSAYGDEVAERFHLGGALVGVVLLAVVTSFPELVIGATSGVIGSADFAIGNALGSNLYNLTIVAVADGFYRSGTLLSTVSYRVLLACVMSQMLVAGAVLAMVLHSGLPKGVETFALVLTYAVCLRMIARSEQGERRAVEALEQGATVDEAAWLAVAAPSASELTAEPGDQPQDETAPARAAALAARPLQAVSTPALFARVGLCALLVLVAGPPMVHAADALAASSTLGSGFVGSIFLAVVGSLPELAVCIGCVRLGAYDMAVGNVFGSNMFNIVLLFVSDLAYRQGPLLQAASPVQIVLGILVMVLTSVVMIGLLYRSRRAYAGFGVDSLIVLAGYAASVAILYWRG